MGNHGQQWATMDNNGQQLTTIDNNWQQLTTMDNNGQQWTTMDNNPQCYMHLWCTFYDSQYYNSRACARGIIATIRNKNGHKKEINERGCIDLSIFMQLIHKLIPFPLSIFLKIIHKFINFPQKAIMRRECTKVIHNDFLSMQHRWLFISCILDIHPGVDIIFVWTLGGKGQWVLYIHSSIDGGTWMRIWTRIKSFVDVFIPSNNLSMGWR